MIKLKDRICRSHGFYSLGVESMLLEFLNDVNRWAWSRQSNTLFHFSSTVWIKPTNSF